MSTLPPGGQLAHAIARGNAEKAGVPFLVDLGYDDGNSSHVRLQSKEGLCSLDPQTPAVNSLDQNLLHCRQVLKKTGRVPTC